MESALGVASAWQRSFCSLTRGGIREASSAASALAATAKPFLGSKSRADCSVASTRRWRLGWDRCTARASCSHCSRQPLLPRELLLADIAAPQLSPPRGVLLADVAVALVLAPPWVDATESQREDGDDRGAPKLSRPHVANGGGREARRSVIVHPSQASIAVDAGSRAAFRP